MNIEKISAQEIEGASVYGVRQFSYTVDGIAGRDFDTTVSRVASHQAAIVEDQSKAVGVALRLRQQAAHDLGDALAVLSGILNRYKKSGGTSDDTPDPPILKDSDEAKRLLDLKKRLEEYGYTLSTEDIPEKEGKHCSDSKPAEIAIRRGVAMRAQSRVQELVDVENNNIQQEMSALQGFMKKRDKAYQNVARVVKKYEDTATTIIRAING